MNLSSEHGANIQTNVYILDDEREQSLLGKQDAIRLGIIKIDPKGAAYEIVDSQTVNHISIVMKEEHIVSNDYEQIEIDKSMKNIINDFPKLFEDRTGKFTGDPIKIQIKEGALPVIQPTRRIPLQYVDQLDTEIKRMLHDDIIEDPFELEEPGTE